MLKRFVAFWYEFIVGDDWMVAVGVVLALVVTALVARTAYEAAAWIVMPLATLAILGVSLWRAARAAS
jgi:hypothetical protein